MIGGNIGGAVMIMRIDNPATINFLVGSSCRRIAMIRIPPYVDTKNILNMLIRHFLTVNKQIVNACRIASIRTEHDNVIGQAHQPRVGALAVMVHDIALMD